MSHLRVVSSPRPVIHTFNEPVTADAKVDLLNAIYLAAQDYWIAKKTAVPG